MGGGLPLKPHWESFKLHTLISIMSALHSSFDNRYKKRTNQAECDRNIQRELFSPTDLHSNSVKYKPVVRDEAHLRVISHTLLVINIVNSF